MKVVIDIEANGLHNPSKIWLIVCKELDTGEVKIFRHPTKDSFEHYIKTVTQWIGHNILGYDFIHLKRILGIELPVTFPQVVDTLIVSKLVDYSRVTGHSLEAYGEQFGLPKGDNKSQSFFKEWSQELEDYCVRDTEITERCYNLYLDVVNSNSWSDSLITEHRFQAICNDLNNNGFGFNGTKANKLLTEVNKHLAKLDEDILTTFPPREVLIREFTPKLTKFGTISRTSVPRSLWPDIHKYEADKTYRHTRFDTFNPASHKQVVQVLNEAKWKPEDKTQTHIEVERELNRLKRSRDKENELDIKLLSGKLDILRVRGWKINEHNLGTLPASAPLPARSLAKRILLEARRRTLVEWLSLVQPDGRIHGDFYGIGAWTHRMAHQRPNTANIPSPSNLDGTVKLIGREMRELWCSQEDRVLVGVDAEGIQLRIFAHYINDPEFTDALVKGKKDDKSDPHSLNQRILGSNCKTRSAAKRFIYALLLGAGLDKLAAILGCSKDAAKESLDRLLERYTGFAHLKRTIIPKDGKRGYFLGLDGRRVPIPGQTQRDREHLCMSGYLQNGEAIVVKRAAIRIDDILKDEKKCKKWMFVDIVHDELQSEVDKHIALQVAEIKADAIKIAGEELNLRCPLAGSYWNEDKKKYTIGTDWYQTH